MSLLHKKDGGELRHELLIGLIIIWAILSAIAMFNAWVEVFPAIGAVALAVGVSIFLTHRFTSQEERRLWDNQEEIQLRMIWRYITQMQRGGRKGNDPMTMDELAKRINQSFDSMLKSKHDEVKQETYRYEMIYSVLGTLQWGLGRMLVELVHGL